MTMETTITRKWQETIGRLTMESTVTREWQETIGRTTTETTVNMLGGRIEL